MGLKQTLTQNLLNLSGWHTKQHIVVFESDDWGAIRMPSLEAFHFLRDQGVLLSDKSGYNVCDTLASNDDLELLMETLSSVKDNNGNPAKITFNCCVANPDFQKIRENDFQVYYNEPFTETLKRYPHHDRSFELWKEGMKNNLFQVQFHGREHLNAQMWMQLLRKNVDSVRKAFDKEVFCMELAKQDDPRRQVLAAFNVASKEDYAFACNAIKEGLDLFEKLFGFRPFTMIAPNYTWDAEIEMAAWQNGIRIMQGGHVQRPSYYAKSQGAKYKRHHTGQKSKDTKMKYMVRNCEFEPSFHAYMNADYCMKEIQNAFLYGAPAIVSCHRLNFIGELNPANRDNNLREFKKLLKMITSKYPDVAFMSSDELGKLILD